MDAKTERMQKEIRRMRDEVKAWKSVVDANNAMLAAVVRAAGGSVQVMKADIRAGIQGEFRTEVQLIEDGYILLTREAREDGGTG